MNTHSELEEQVLSVNAQEFANIFWFFGAITLLTYFFASPLIGTIVFWGMMLFAVPHVIKILSVLFGGAMKLFGPEHIKATTHFSWSSTFIILLSAGFQFFFVYLLFTKFIS